MRYEPNSSESATGGKFLPVA